jgi:hypothetical protein
LCQQQRNKQTEIMDYAAKQLKKAQNKLAKLNKAIDAAAQQEVDGLITFDEEVALWNERKELESFIDHLAPFVNKRNLQYV